MIITSMLARYGKSYATAHAVIENIREVEKMGCKLAQDDFICYFGCLPGHTIHVSQTAVETRDSEKTGYTHLSLCLLISPCPSWRKIGD